MKDQMAKGIERQMTKEKEKEKNEESKQSEDATKSQPSADASGQITEVTNQMGDMNFNDGTGADN